MKSNVTEGLSESQILHHVVGRPDPPVELVISAIVAQLLRHKPSKLTISCRCETTILGCDVNWFLSEPNLEFALSGQYVPDQTSINTPRFETILPIYFHSFAFFKNRKLIWSSERFADKLKPESDFALAVCAS